MREEIPAEVIEGVRDGGTYIFDRDGWHAQSARAGKDTVKLGNTEPKPKMSPTQALRTLERSTIIHNFLKQPGEIREAIDALWDFVLLGKDSRE